jgi:hypothetical protein
MEIPRERERERKPLNLNTMQSTCLSDQPIYPNELTRVSYLTRPAMYALAGRHCSPILISIIAGLLR